jgi:hypothetical protein
MALQHIIPFGTNYDISITEGSSTIFNWFELK